MTTIQEHILKKDSNADQRFGADLAVILAIIRLSEQFVDSRLEEIIDEAIDKMMNLEMREYKE